MSGVSLRNITKVFGAVQALTEVSLDVTPGEMVALLGPSGCGKTTLLRCVAGLEYPEHGHVFVDGADITSTPPRKRPIGMVFQHYALFPNMTLRQNVAFPLVVRRERDTAIKSRVDELLELVNLTDQADRYPNQISGGEQQRGALARALAPSPQVLLLDEPLSALDALVRHRLRDEIRRIQQTIRITALYVTHDQAEAMAIADRVAVMNLGKIEEIARPSELYDQPATRFSAGFIGNRNALELPVSNGQVQLGRALRAPAPGDEVARALVFFRPEDVKFMENGCGQSAVVEGKMFQGSLTRLHLVVKTGGQTTRLYADVPSRQANPLEPGCPVCIAVDAANVQVFPADA